MSITSAIVLLATTWFMVFLCVLPVRHRSQADAGAVVPGTPVSAPAEEVVGRKAKLTTWITLPVWAVLCAVILFSGITVQDFDWFRRMGPGGGWKDVPLAEPPK